MKRISLLSVVGAITVLSSVFPAIADEERLTAYDISWPQCPETFPVGEFEFAVIGLTGGKPFTSNECFPAQYRWARMAETNPDVYINLDFPREGRPEALSGPRGYCAELDDRCRGYNWGYALAKDAVGRAKFFGVSPGRYWLDVEVDNHWTETGTLNAQVIRGTLDYFAEVDLPIGIYGTNYQWGLITDGYRVGGDVPLWVAGAEDAASARARCGDSTYEFAGGEIWMVQFLEGEFDENVRCSIARNVRSGSAAARRTILSLFSATRGEFAPAPPPARTVPTLRSDSSATVLTLEELRQFWSR